jgi:hypothetical protein
MNGHNNVMKWNHHPLRSLALLGFAFYVLVLTGCAEINHLRDAQSSFNEAARIENQMKISGDMFSDSENLRDSKNLMKETEVRVGYASAIASIDKLKPEQQEKLKADKLWGVALTIKAMSYWRLGDYDKMEATAQEIKSISDTQVYPRDRALLLALPGLRRVDEAHAKLEAPINSGSNEQKAELKKERLDAIERLVNNASDDFSKARQSVSEQHQVRAYLIQAELAGYKNLLDARAKLSGGTLSVEEESHVAMLVKELDCSFHKSLSGDDLLTAQIQIVAMWVHAFGMESRSDLACEV